MITVTTPLIPPGQVTATDVLVETSAIRRDVGQLLTKVEVINVHHQDQAAQLADHETRIRQVEQSVPPDLALRLRVVERWQWRAGGIVAALAAAAGLLGSFLGTVLAHAH